MRNPIAGLTSSAKSDKDQGHSGAFGKRHAQLLDEIRSQNLSLRSDNELRRLLTDSADLAIAFAVVDETIKRRLGWWRLFDSEFDKSDLGCYEIIVNDVLQAAPYELYAEYVNDDSFFDSDAFSSSVYSYLDGLSLDDDEREVVFTMVYVALKGEIGYWEDASLSGAFYETLSKTDEAGLLTFAPTDEQLVAGIALYDGGIVEMSAGEGKTIAAAFSAVLRAVRGENVHVATSNDYLAARDANLLAPVYESLGLTVSAILGYMRDDERRRAYECDIVYGTVREFGFDYLRDSMKADKDVRVQMALHSIIVDEADHALIDGASTPLIISGDSVIDDGATERADTIIRRMVSAQAAVVDQLHRDLEEVPQSSKARLRLMAKLHLADPRDSRLVEHFAQHQKDRSRVLNLIDDDHFDAESDRLVGDLYYALDSKAGNVTLLEKGVTFVSESAGFAFDSSIKIESDIRQVKSDLTVPFNERRNEIQRLERALSRRHRWVAQVYNALRAHVLLKRDTDYLLTGDSITLIDALTGRTLPNNVYQNGLHGAVQIKEGVGPTEERETLAQITVPGLLKRYAFLSGMTGTAIEARDEFKKQYGVNVISVQSHNMGHRRDIGARLYGSRDHKLAALIDEVRLCRRVGRPVLIGSLTVEQSNEISSLLGAKSIEYNLLNAVNSTSEERIIREAGTLGAVTIATNMAGRGTDILLDGELNYQITCGYVEYIRKLMSETANGIVIVRCGSSEEASIIGGALSELGSQLLIETCSESDFDLIVSKADSQGNGDQYEIEFGLGLHVIGTEMNSSARVDRQLVGRSGRQGEFGSSVFLLSQEDNAMILAGEHVALKTSERTSDHAGRLFYSGPELQESLTEIQERIEENASESRAMLRDYMSVIDAQSVAHARMVEEAGQSEAIREKLNDWLTLWANRLVERHFPGPTVESYDARFGQLIDELQIDCNVDANSLYGLGPLVLATEIVNLTETRIKDLESQWRSVSFSKLAAWLYVHAAQEAWLDHRNYLDDMIRSISLVGGHRASVVEYTLRAHESYQQMAQGVADVFLTRLLSFESEALPEDNKPKSTEHHKDIAAILV